ncbi:type I-D CRISPR-associated protein Cas10d/Csc3 [Phormidium sp. LEGE 05292]|uniref:type I-D CRISPR-associated protein Cas10d/Csc3 n=1 Tax=[Phormidium] sp. LEGE 05292 TaxID=767427 RepID=UPI00187F33E7|nr:type I-D CRISPR-associated protein Cas10d/Csc3 [Phormidium sp. LEGE 05292]MBE9225409.1 type I-D CRISPR-associated protein Cas10d/Csc3 [Phormidium sp. LEGE 05292]
MTTLLQRLLIETLSKKEKESVLRKLIDIILPPLEQHFALVPALGGVEPQFANKPDQSLLVHVLNGLLVAWNLSQELPDSLSEIEQRLLCLGFMLHDYDKWLHDRGEESPGAHQVSAIVQRCQKLGELLNFTGFWEDWRDYSLDICFLAQNTQRKRGSNRIASNWENDEQNLRLDYLELDRLCDLLAFGDIAVHMNDPGDIVTQKSGERLQEILADLGLDEDRKLIYHRLRDCRGLLTNRIHNAVDNFAKEQNWFPFLYFAQGTVYLAPQESDIPNLDEIQSFVWENIIQGDEEKNLRGLGELFSNGDVGFIRDGKGLKIAPLTRELFNPVKLICLLPNVIIQTVKNIKDPATPKRLEKLDLSESDRQFLEAGADVWADRLAEFIILAQKEFFAENEEYNNWVLTTLGLQTEILPEQTKIQKGGVNYGWYQVAAHYIAQTPLNRDPGSQELTEFLREFGERLATWADENNFLLSHQSETYEVFCDYLCQYFEISGSNKDSSPFANELSAYAESKVKNKAICSLSSGEFPAEDQFDSVVLFKPQQYSNKNTLGGRRIKRGISKLWSLEMILRQAYWAVPAGKLEEKQPIFLYIFPAYVYSPQIARAISQLVKKLKKINLWEVRKQWLKAEMNYRALQDLLMDEKEPKTERYGRDYSTKDLPFMAMTHTETRGKSYTDAWVEPAFLALILPMLLGVKVVATPSSDPIYASDKEFLESVRLDGTAGFWNFLGLKTDLRLQELDWALKHVLVAYSLHLDTRSNRPDARWQAFNGTVREVMTDVLNIFALANEKLREEKREATTEEIQLYWNYAQIWSDGEPNMQDKLKITKRLVSEYRRFYQVGMNDSSHAILLPLSKALEEILSVPEHWDEEELIFQGAGQLQAALDRQEVYKRPLIKDKSVPYEIRQAQEFEAIHTFMTTCVKELFGGMCKGDRALLQENRNRIKSGAEFAYRWLALQEKQASSEQQKSNQTNKEGEAA